MKKTIIKIDGELCIGCGACVNRCRQDALQMVDGKAVLVNDNYCDGLGNCIGECPVGAITLKEREIAPVRLTCECPATMVREIKRAEAPGAGVQMPFRDNLQSSELRGFPVQLHLVNPEAEAFRGADLLLAADCTAFACGDFHNRFLRGKKLAIACPKLDADTQDYVDKLALMIDAAGISTLTVLVMEVPCCCGLVRIAEAAREQARRNVPIKIVTLSVEGGTIKKKSI